MIVFQSKSILVVFVLLALLSISIVYVDTLKNLLETNFELTVKQGFCTFNEKWVVNASCHEKRLNNLQQAARYLIKNFSIGLSQNFQAYRFQDGSFF